VTAFRLRTAAVAVAVGMATVLAGGTAWAWWSSTGTGSGSGTTGNVIALTTTASTPSTTTLLPDGSAPLVLTVTNPNPMPVVVTGVQLDGSRAVGVSGAQGGCATPPLTVNATTNLTLAGGSTTTVTVPAAITLGSTAASGCQGATFTVPVLLTGRTP
jgi:hypothetical protein